MKPTNEGDVINQGAPLRVKFSNVREKIKVLQASRNASQTLKDERISIIEDFTDKVRENTHLQGSSSQVVGDAGGMDDDDDAHYLILTIFPLSF